MKVLALLVLCGAALCQASAVQGSNRAIGTNAFYDELEEALKEIDFVKLGAAVTSALTGLEDLSIKFAEEFSKIEIEPEALVEFNKTIADATAKMTEIIKPIIDVITEITIPGTKQIKADFPIQEIIDAIEKALNISFPDDFAATVTKALKDAQAVSDDTNAKIKALAENEKYPNFKSAVELINKTLVEAQALFKPILDELKPILDVINNAMNSGVLANGSFALLVLGLISRYLF